MPEPYTIGQLARAADVPTSTVRYYERVGLLEPEDRSHGNYRQYRAESLHRLQFIRAAQAIGFTLDDVKLLLGDQDRDAPSCREVQERITQRLEEIFKQLKNLRHVQKVLELTLLKCRAADQARCCHVIETLRSSSSSRS